MKYLILVGLLGTSAWASENCFMQGELRGDPAYYYTWTRDSWAGKVQIVCGTEVTMRNVRFISWGQSQAVRPDSILNFYLDGISHKNLDQIFGALQFFNGRPSLDGFGRIANIAVQTSFGLLTATLEFIGPMNIDFKQWLSNGLILISTDAP